MVAVPEETPVTTPVDDVVAIEGGVLPHVPPETASCRVTVDPIQVIVVPVMPGGVGLTIIVDVEIQPVPSE
jgi:hypothetical protein